MSFIYDPVTMYQMSSQKMFVLNTPSSIKHRSNLILSARKLEPKSNAHEESSKHCEVNNFSLGGITNSRKDEINDKNNHDLNLNVRKDTSISLMIPVMHSQQKT